MTISRGVFVILLAASVAASACGGSTGPPLEPSTVTAPVIQPAPTPTPPIPTPIPTSSFSIVLGPTRGIAGVQLSLAPGNIVVGAVLTFGQLYDVTEKVALHELTHVGGAFHNDKPQYLMYPVVNMSGSSYSTEESQALRAGFAMAPGTSCPAGSSTLVLQMICGDNTVDIGNPGMRPVTRVIGNLNVRVAPELESKLDVLRSAAAAWTAQSGFTVTLTVGPTTASVRALSVPGARTVVIVD